MPNTEVTMAHVEEFIGVGTVYRADGSPLRDQRRYSITIVPWYEPGRPLAVGSWVELRDREPLEFENERLTVQVREDLWFTFRIIDVSENSPQQYTFAPEEWPGRRAG
jgi:hypothetical protein